MKPPQQQALSMTMGGCSSKHAHLYTPHCVDASAECLPISRCLAPTQVNLEPISGSNHNNATTMHQTQMGTVSIGLHKMKLSVCKPVKDLA